MRSSLQGTTALVTVGGLVALAGSQPAAAQGIKLGLGGYMNHMAGVGDYDSDEALSGEDFNPTNLFSDGEVHFQGEFTADNGITFGANVQLESFQSDPDQVDENYGYVEGAFGRLLFGSENSATYLMQFSGPEAGLIVNSGWVTDFIPNPGVEGMLSETGGSTVVDIGNDENRLTYFSPRLYGFQLGVSYAPTVVSTGEGSNNPANEDSQTRNAVETAVNYVRSFNGFEVAVAGGFGTARQGDDVSGALGQPDERIYQYHAGINVGYAGATIGGAYVREEGGRATQGRAFDVGVSYRTGPWTVALYYFNSVLKGTVGRNDGMRAGNLGVDYALAPGVVLKGSLLYAELEGAADRDGDGSESIGEFGRREGLVGALGVQFTF